ncbi:phage endopeptidase (plasmid) [Clostridium botulinum C/D str. BKT12695]|nr:phage endopeptidase [Clostridium botulinum C/D str. BKT12695]
MIKIINVYDSKETNFEHNGLAVLDKCIRAEVQEELNGLYELELEYPIYNKKWEYLIEDNIIKAPTLFGPQLFRIYHKAKNLTSIKVNARHIFYDLLDNLVEEINIRGLSGKDALKKAMDNLAYTTNFKYFSNISWKNNIYLDDEKGDVENKNPIEVLFTLISIYGGELRRDNLNFLWLENVGQDNGVVISYGKNIKGIEDDLNRDSVITRIKAVGQDGLTLDEKYIDSPYINNYPHPKIKVVEFNDCNDYESLRKAAKNYYKKNKCDLPILNYKVDFIELSKTEEYKDFKVLETLNLGDIVTVKHKILKIDVKQKVIKYKYDCLRNRYINIELGSFKENLNKIFEETDDNLDKLDLDIKDTNKRLRESEKRFRSSIEKTDSRITLAVEEIGKTNTKIEETANSITLEVNNKIDKCNSKIEQTEKSITSTVNGQIRDVDGKIKDCNTKIEQNADNIALVVYGGEINGNALVSAINMSDKKIGMRALNIDFDGYVTFRNLERGETTIDGSCIKAGTIDADEIGSRISKVSDYVIIDGGRTSSVNGIGTKQRGDGRGYLQLISSKGVMVSTPLVDEDMNQFVTEDWVRQYVQEKLENWK